MPTISEALSIALQHHRAGRLQAAEEIYRQILQADPKHADALHLLGLIAHQLGRQELAAQSILQAIGLNGNAALFHHNLAKVYEAWQRIPESMACYRRTLELNPDYVEALVNLGVALSTQGKTEEAAACFRRALTIDPDLPVAHMNLGNELKARGDLDDAVNSYRRVLELQPGFAEAHYNLGLALMEQGKFEEAAASYRRALDLKPGLAEAHHNLAITFKERGRLEEAIACSRRALALKPDLAEANNNLAMTLLLRGDYKEGWARYESRLALLSPRGFSAPRWQGEPLAGQTILLHCEQGFGDTLHFLRYAAALRERTGAERVILECQPELARLLRGGGDVGLEIWRAGTSEPGAWPRHDWRLPLLSLPLGLGILAPWPAAEPYVSAEPTLRATWKERMPETGKLRVGVAWKGNPAHERDRWRSLNLEKLLPLFETPDISFYSLQFEATAGENAMLAAAGAIDLTPRIDDFADTAAIAAELDLIISADTALVHLAGALGRPVWTLLPFVPDWRWGMEGAATAWYPTMRLFRQPALGDWNAVVQRVTEELVQLRKGTLGRGAPFP